MNDKKIDIDDVATSLLNYEIISSNKDNSEMHMSELFEREKKLQRKLYGASWPWDIDRFIIDYAMHLHMEVDEMLREVNYKLQTKKRKEIDHALLRGEIADVFIFALAAATAEFTTYEEFIQTVKDKITYNENRNDWDANK